MFIEWSIRKKEEKYLPGTTSNRTTHRPSHGRASNGTTYSTPNCGHSSTDSATYYGHSSTDSATYCGHSSTDGAAYCGHFATNPIPYADVHCQGESLPKRH